MYAIIYLCCKSCILSEINETGQSQGFISVYTAQNSNLMKYYRPTNNWCPVMIADSK